MLSIFAALWTFFSWPNVDEVFDEEISEILDANDDDNSDRMDDEKDC